MREFGEGVKCAVFTFSIYVKGVWGENGTTSFGVLEGSFAHCGVGWKGKMRPASEFAGYMGQSPPSGTRSMYGLGSSRRRTLLVVGRELGRRAGFALLCGDLLLDGSE